jgi:DNA-binding NtrC family response regulator
MSDRTPSPPAAPRPIRLQHARAQPGADAPGLCALEDYTCLTGESFAMRSLRAQLRRAAPHFRVALIIGETGTGKETVALALHRLTSDSDATFITHTPASLLNAIQDLTSRPALLTFPDPNASPARTTFFLADIGEISHGEQVYLLQSLKRLAALRNGVERPRLIFATGRDLRGLSGAGQFDRNLYRMISAVEILLPPLRSRPEDIPLITCGLLSRSASTGAFDGRALSRLQCHDWPGNIRELERVVDLARQHAGDGVDGVIEAMHLPALGEFVRSNQPPRIETRVDRLDDVIQNHVLDVLMRCSGNKVRAAERLGISRSTLYRMLDATSPASALDRIA